MKTNCYAALSATTPLVPFHCERRNLRSHDVHIQILFCGVCHSDLHTARNEWKSTVYPCVPGHEIVGRVIGVGKEVRSFTIGQRVAVGCMVDSCRRCSSCKEHLEQYCENGAVYTYNGRDMHDGSITYGGYSTHITVDEKFVLHIPDSFTASQLPGVAPLLCAGITTYSPLRHWNVSKGSKVGVVGLGGLGHMAIKIAHAMGAHVVLFTSSAKKVQDGKRLGADEVVLSSDVNQVKKYANSLHCIIDTVSVSHDLHPFLELLARDGTMCMVGAPPVPHPALAMKDLIFKRRQLVGSLIGGIQETQEMLDFCAKHHITSDIELISIQQINEAYERMLKNDVFYRFVIDTASFHISSAKETTPQPFSS